MILRGCHSEGDLRTIDAWATFVGTSYSSLGELCRVVGVQPHAARDLMRLLGALIRARKEACPVEQMLDISDRRTLRLMLGRGGLSTSSDAARIRPTEFLEHQQLIDHNHLVVRRIRTALLQCDSGL